MAPPPEKTAEELRRQWFFLLPVTWAIDKDGYVSIVGKKERPDYFRGAQILPKEIEVNTGLSKLGYWKCGK